MLRSEFGTPSAAFVAEQRRIALPLAAAAPADGFAALMRQLDREIGDYIARGDSAAATGESGATTLNPEARAWLAQQQRLVPDVAEAAEGMGDVAGAQTLPGLSAAQRSFLARIAPLAQEAGELLGVSPQILSAQAALESGWGERPLRQGDGSDSHNLFGIKAGGGWQGGTLEATTTEFEGDAAVKRSERFRSYAGVGEAFRDFTRLLSDSPRYRAALDTGSDVRAYARALMRGGYASDPAYADKLVRLTAQVQGG